MERRHLILMRTGGPAQPRTLPPEEGTVNASARVLRGPRRAWLPDVLIAAAIFALVLLAAVACTGGSGPSSASPGGSPAAGGSAAAPSAVGYSHCMRLHAVPNYPDPTVDSGGRPGFNLVPIHGTNWNSPQIQNKIYECEHMMPAGGGVPAIYPGGPG